MSVPQPAPTESVHPPIPLTGAISVHFVNDGDSGLPFTHLGSLAYFTGRHAQRVQQSFYLTHQGSTESNAAPMNDQELAYHIGHAFEQFYGVDDPQVEYVTLPKSHGYQRHFHHYPYLKFQYDR